MARFTVFLMAVFTVLALSAPAARAQEDQQQGLFTLTSPDFTDGGVIPAKYTCDGKAPESIPLHWENVPEHAQSFALAVTDPDAPKGVYTQWIAYNLPAKTRDLPAAAANLAGLGIDAAEGLNSAGKASYDPPCPPSGDHHYVFRLYALDTTLALPSGTTVDEKALNAALEGHVLAQSEITARYSRHQ